MSKELNLSRGTLQRAQESMGVETVKTGKTWQMRLSSALGDGREDNGFLKDG
jgi:hypothetical protein